MYDNQEKRKHIEEIVERAISQANQYRSPNSTFNIRQISLQLTDVVIIIGTIIGIMLVFVANYFTIIDCISVSQKTIQELDKQIKSIQVFKIDTQTLLEKHKDALRHLENDTKQTKRISTETSHQVQDVYSNFNMLLKKIDDLERSIKKIEK